MAGAQNVTKGHTSIEESAISMETKEHMITKVHSDASLVGRDRAIEGLRHALRSGSFGLSLFPKALKLVLKRRSWKERKIERTGEIAKFERFTDFVVTPPPEGLGAKVDQLRALAGAPMAGR